ncbi:amine dehydrogenase large subunit [Phenylobacterium sp.]|uniref:amine dehydrogenase large subunit n=1 Tax=Phenylobacterium sp. TaxID=1871053 RepID=UPI0030F3735C
MLRSRNLTIFASVIALCGSGLSGAQAAPPVLNPPLRTETLPTQKVGEHWVWLQDYAGGLYARAILVNAETGDWLGTVDTGWEGIKLDFPRDPKVFYNLGLFMSRGFHGERVDALEIFDRKTLGRLGEVIIPPKMIRGWPNLNHSAVTDDDRFLLVQFFTPASSIGVVDLRARKYVGEIESAGCAHVMALGDRRFMMLCGDGSALEVRLDERGRELTRVPHKGLFDPNGDPLHGTGVRQGDAWTLVSQKGAIQTIDISSGGFRPLPVWTPEPAPDGPPAVPAQIMQNFAIHRSTNRLYILMHRGPLEPKGGGIDYHRQYGSEVWVLDLASHKVLKRLTLPRPSEAVAISQDGHPYLYVSTLGLTDVLVLDPDTGAQIRTLRGGVTPLIMQPVEPSA